ncbi:glutamine amidotransferase [Pseudarthrobacter phenanthrenivorans]|uniref:Glutamine amidotransferase n=1 Tax=Pseudarthrobacter phenanthrenivorans TaxID=361575 RepID=A0A3B0FY81_PSEPS|nr:glutamine amidotransferase [Pseudarthrobacter phenanthrenivorans]RKO24870.1 glutamine amidotransferase [Pseudarthrobacter phenanthrenivorans]TPV51482.1 glutamine amidotransferase [Pseudarthrobacter phenanthrenivorans]
MLPFLLLASRAEDAAAEDEYAAYLRYGGLEPHELRRVRLEAAPLPDLDLSNYSGVIVGGSPFTSSDPPEQKSAVQHRVERELSGLLDELVARDFPFLGACYGVGTLGRHQGAVIDRTYGEPLGGVEIELTEAGLEDPLLAGLSPTFTAFTGHKEACTVLPPHAVLLARSVACPVHMFRIRENLYATQFHPELDAEGLCTRIDIYRHAGYFPPESAEQLMADARQFTATEPMKILRNFVARYAR